MAGEERKGSPGRIVNEIGEEGLRRNWESFQKFLIPASQNEESVKTPGP